MELTLDLQDLYRLLACLAHTAKHFEDEVARQQRITTIIIGQPLGLLGAVISEAIGELFANEGQQLRQLQAKLARTTGLDPVGDPTVGSPL
jgi:hypothetical protein